MNKCQIALNLNKVPVCLECDLSTTGVIWTLTNKSGMGWECKVDSDPTDLKKRANSNRYTDVWSHCPTGQYLQAGICQSCHSECATCIGGNTLANCIGCSDSVTEKRYFNKTNSMCVVCDAANYEYYNPATDSCDYTKDCKILNCASDDCNEDMRCEICEGDEWKLGYCVADSLPSNKVIVFTNQGKPEVKECSSCETCVNDSSNGCTECSTGSFTLNQMYGTCISSACSS